MGVVNPDSLDDGLALLSVLQELTVATLELFDPRRNVDRLAERLCERLGCPVVLLLQASDSMAGASLKLLGSAGISPLSRAHEVKAPARFDWGSLDLPYPEIRAEMTRAVVPVGPDLPASPGWSGEPQDDAPPFSALLLFSGAPGLAPRYLGMARRLAVTLHAALDHRRLFLQSMMEQMLLEERGAELEAANASLASIRSRLAALLANLTSGVLAEDEERRITNVNLAFCRIFGIAVAPEQLIGADCRDAAGAASPLLADSDTFAARIEGLIEVRSPVLNEELRLRDGRVLERDYVPVEFERGRRGSLWIYRDVTERRTVEEEFRILNERLETLVAARTEDLTNANRELSESLDRLRQTQAELVQAGKMASLGTLVAGISHELNNPIGIISGYVQGILRRAPLDDASRSALQAVDRQAQRCALIVRSLLDFSRKTPSESAPIALGDLLSSSLAIVHPRAHERTVRIARDTQEVDDASLMACATEIESALLNLMLNAIDASPAGGVVKVRARLAEKAAIRGVEIRVEDVGAGIPEEALPHVFDPFFTTKPPGQGTGLGLALTSRIVDAHGGTIDIESTPGRGTTVRVWLPLAPA